MLLLLAHNLVKTFGTRTLFEAEKLEIHDGDRIGLVGCNGDGKSTLLHILCGDEPYDDGVIDRRCEIALIRQSGETEDESDKQLLGTLSLTHCACKSGGERTRYAIATALSQHAPLLFADEPTTNLDMNGIDLLQKMLTDYRGAVVLVSHDRSLLDAFCNVIWAIEDTHLRIFPGTYTEWIAQRERERDFAQFAYEQYRDEKNRLECEAGAIKQEARSMRKPLSRMSSSEWLLHKNTASIRQKHVQGRAKAIDSRIAQLEVHERPSNQPQVRMALGAANPITAKISAAVEGLTVRYDGHAVLQDVSFSLPTGSRTVMLGGNGAGKTTAVAHLVSGGDHARHAGGVKIGYFSQNHDVLDLNRTVLENAREDSPLPEHEVRTILANLYISGDDVFKPVRVLSGGERAKAAFAKLLASSCNLLVLDEPTNHIDTYTAEALESLLVRWQGTLLVITHDRRLTERIANRLLFVENGSIRSFDGTWTQWQEECRRLAAPRDDMHDLIEQMRRAAEGTKGLRAK
ncbi:ABC-F family ATP-binding cassette domain-containing protein [Oscillospiraceae bacterium PP1C4]